MEEHAMARAARGATARLAASATADAARHSSTRYSTSVTRYRHLAHITGLFGYRRPYGIGARAPAALIFSRASSARARVRLSLSSLLRAHVQCAHMALPIVQRRHATRTFADPK